MADAGAGGAAAEAAIGDQCDLIAQAHAGDVARRGKHFLHAWTAARAFVANNDNVAGFNFARENSGAGIVLAFENDAGTFEDEVRPTVGFERIADAGGLDDTAFRRELAVKNRKAAVLGVGGVFGADTIIGVKAKRRVVGHQAAGLDLFQRRGARVKIGFADLPAAQAARANQR